MPRVAPRVPESSDVLCERCGYVLNGLPDTGRCPECGKPVSESVGDNRTEPAWETAIDAKSGIWLAFWKTNFRLTLHPARFYQTFTTRGPLALAWSFAFWNCWMASILFALTAAAHATWYWYEIEGRTPPGHLGGEPVIFIALWVALTLGCFFVLTTTTRIAARLTTLEGTYRGYRLPYPIVLRALYYHSAHYLPVALITAATVLCYQLLLFEHIVHDRSAPVYLYTLCAEVVIGAVYLFQTYWMGMRNMMYANR